MAIARGASRPCSCPRRTIRSGSTGGRPGTSWAGATPSCTSCITCSVRSPTTRTSPRTAPRSRTAIARPRSATRSSARARAARARRSRIVAETEADAWNEGAAAWVGLIRDGDPPMHAHDATIWQLVPPPGGLTLDVGCGEGRWTRELGARGYDVVGIDVSEKLVEEARAAHPDGRYDIAGVEQLPVADAAAHFVLCVNVLMHVFDLGKAADELARVLCPGGVLVTGLMHPVAEAGRYDEEEDELRFSGYFEREPHTVPLGHVHVEHQHRTVEEYVRTFLAAGFALDDLREVPGRTGAFPRYLDLKLTRT